MLQMQIYFLSNTVQYTVSNVKVERMQKRMQQRMQQGGGGAAAPLPDF